ncbi:hydroxymethylpyrimidine/phosphomethylpyrimidine kinase [Kushneria phosphatilytica]|uniref:hydroxymethylpyrimidine kinase n=2 Tax=Kushneria phosphatilytica TaxID=657387 RepID=A0A1S1NP01_9GAMM|nr:hydroxymethylpyrimidine/phosphomethylpyrimidine kinase [Kushneria phosphatilytica]OHV09002.1 hydroxymethylpyrimidine/phosphomethylpyrimidine kinase [Kushneria phosphatilytica]QEL12925.1 hydroxymethylpyrimidine/phosphomethylpyrimidine kinase [Kushneria phosphatilytica]
MAAGTPPIVLVLAGHDPTGGAGLIADAEAVRAQGGWALTVPTALTVQTTRDVEAVMPCSASDLTATARAVTEDMPPAAIKTGLIADLPTLEAVAELCACWPQLPLVVDPVLRAGGGRELSSSALLAAFHQRLLPQATVLTPNLAELARLAPQGKTAEERAGMLLKAGAGAVLVTGTDDTRGNQVIHTLYQLTGSRQWQWPRLPGQYHGSGCTLASALAAALAAGISLEAACERAQYFSWQALQHALRPGHDQALPDRWAAANELSTGGYRNDGW